MDLIKDHKAESAISVCESEIPPARPARRTDTEVMRLVDLLQFGNIFFSQVNDFEVR